MVIDSKPPPEPTPSTAPPPSYFSEAPPGPPPHHQSYSGPGYPPPVAQYNAPQPTPQGVPRDVYQQWGNDYRNQLYARCAQGNHEVTTSFGLCGIICAILLFPIGLICLCIDTEKKCARCGVRLG